MKKVFALILCLALLVALPVGCKKKAPEKAELTDSIISADLLKNDHLYNLAHCGKFSSIDDMKITEKTEKNDTVSLSVTAKAISPCAEAQLSADMTYTLTNNQWKLQDIALTKVITPTAAPNQESVLMEIDNYLAFNQDSISQGKNIALAIQGEEHHSFELNPRAVTWSFTCDPKTKTAKLNASLKSEALTFSGYYNLTFDEKTGWAIESEKQENGQHYLLLHLDTFQQKTADKK